MERRGERREGYGRQPRRFGKLLDLLRTRPTHSPLAWLGRDLTVAFLGHTLSKGLGILTFIVMTRALSPREYGAFMLAYSVFEIGLYLSDLGLDPGTTRFVSKGIRTRDEAGTRGVLRAVFLAKVAMASAMLAAGWALAPLVSGRILALPEMTPYLRIAFISAYGVLLTGFYQSYFGARLQFLRNAAFSCLAPAVILVAVALARVRGSLDVASCLRIYAWSPLVVTAVATVVLGHRFLGGGGSIWPPLREVWRFSRWIYVTNVLGAVRFRINSILLARLATLPEVGLYNYADKLASVLTLLTSSITTVFVPRASHLLTRAELKSLLRWSYFGTLLLLPALVLVPFVARPLIGVLAPEYVETAPVFTVLFVSILFSLAAMPSYTVLYSVNRPQVETAVEAVALALTVIVGYSLIRSHGALGAAATMLVQRAISSAAIVTWVFVTIYRETPEAVTEAVELSE